MAAEPCTAFVAAGGLRGFVPRPEGAVVGIWGPEASLVKQVALGPGQRLVIGRRDDAQLTPPGQPGLLSIRLPVERDLYISRQHLQIAHGPAGWRLIVLPGVRNPGRTRNWGDLHWRRLSHGELVEPRQGLVSVLLPGAPHYRITLTAGECRHASFGGSSRASGVITEQEDTPPHGVLTIQPAQLEALVGALADALCWPPAVGNGRVRKWSEFAGGGDSRRRAYDRLAAAVSADPTVMWIDNHDRGVDPELLRELVSSGHIDYHLVYRKFNATKTVSLIPTHHTHDVNGQRKVR